jgi:hypothetical protein
MFIKEKQKKNTQKHFSHGHFVGKKLHYPNKIIKFIVSRAVEIL